MVSFFEWKCCLCHVCTIKVLQWLTGELIPEQLGHVMSLYMKTLLQEMRCPLMFFYQWQFFSTGHLHHRRTNLTSLPHNFVALETTGDSVCFFYSLIILLSGSVEATLFLRLAATVYGICYASHYVSMVSVVFHAVLKISVQHLWV